MELLRRTPAEELAEHLLNIFIPCLWAVGSTFSGCSADQPVFAIVYKLNSRGAGALNK